MSRRHMFKIVLGKSSLCNKLCPMFFKDKRLFAYAIVNYLFHYGVASTKRCIDLDVVADKLNGWLVLRTSLTL